MPAAEAGERGYERGERYGHVEKRRDKRGFPVAHEIASVEQQAAPPNLDISAQFASQVLRHLLVSQPRRPYPGPFFFPRRDQNGGITQSHRLQGQPAVARPTGYRVRYNHRRERAVRAAVHDDLDVLGDEMPGGRHARAVAHDRRVPLGGGGDVLVAVVDHAHRLAHALGQQGCVDGYDRGVVLLAPEATAGLRLRDDGLLVGQVGMGRRPVVGHGQAALGSDPDVAVTVDQQGPAAQGKRRSRRTWTTAAASSSPAKTITTIAT